MRKISPEELRKRAAEIREDGLEGGGVHWCIRELELAADHIEQLEASINAALGVIEIPAEHHRSMVYGDEWRMTSLPRFSSGALRLNKECFDLREQLRKVMGKE